MTDIQRIRIIAFKVLNKTATPEEIASLKQYLETTHQSSPESILFDIDAADPVQPMQLSDRERSDMLSAILGKPPKERPSISKYHRIAWMAAASVLLVTAGSIVFRRIGAKEKAAINYVMAKAAFGEQKRLLLPDGTRVVLNAGSEIQYPSTFSDTVREVRIKGEAFVDVVRIPEQPFIVQTAHLSTRVLGTSFNVRDFEEETGAQVQVRSGKVQVALNPQGEERAALVVLNASQEADYTAGTAEGLKMKQVDGEEIAGWTSHKLFFNDKNIREILQELERIYNVRFNAGADSAFLKRYTFHIDKINLDSTLETISLLTDVHFVRNKSIIQVR